MCIRDRLQGVPPQVVAAAVTQGAETAYGAQAGITVPPYMPANYSFNVGVQGRVALSDVQTGPGLEQSQTFRASLQLQQDDRLAVERTMLQKLYRLPDSSLLPEGVRDALQSGPFQEARDRIERNPALRTLARGFLFGLAGIAILALLPLVVRDQLKQGAVAYGVLMAGFGAGALLAGLTSTALRRRLSDEQLSLIHI